MIADLKPYPTIKDPGVPWLGDIPEHWEVRRDPGMNMTRCATTMASTIYGEECSDSFYLC